MIVQLEYFKSDLLEYENETASNNLFNICQRPLWFEGLLYVCVCTIVKSTHL